MDQALDMRRVGLVLASLIVPFLLLRLSLYISPDTDFTVAGYNIHHLFTGLLLITIGGVPLALFRGASRLLDVAAILFGVGLSLALDEWVYLIATDGSNAAYLLPVSFWGGLIMISIATLYVLLLVLIGRRHNRHVRGPTG
ncbi:MAG: hypothetical protein ACE5G0_08580 [Rhodothermales bacterium]